MNELKKIFFRLRGATFSMTLFLVSFLLPTQLGKHYWPEWSYIHGIRIDYLSPTVYLLDIVLLIFAIMQLWRVFREKYGVLTSLPVIFLGGLVITNVVASLSSLHSTYSWLILIIRFVSMYGIVMLFRKFPLPFLTGLTAGTLLQLVLVLLQFTHQASLQGVWYWLGERDITLSLPNVAKVGVWGKELLRPYGTFSHPNVLGGFYAMLFFFVLSQKSLFSGKSGSTLRLALLFTSSTLVLLSSSKGAIVALCVGHLYVLVKRRIVAGTVIPYLQITLIFLVLGIFLPLSGDIYSLEKRFELFVHSLNVILTYPFFGVGLGNYVLSQSEMLAVYRGIPIVQPVHNAFLLVFSEIGLVGVLLAYTVGKISHSNLRPLLRHIPLITVFLITGCFDHYWITQPQTQVLLLFVLIYVYTQADTTVREG